MCAETIQFLRLSHGSPSHRSTSQQKLNIVNPDSRKDKVIPLQGPKGNWKEWPGLGQEGGSKINWKKRQDLVGRSNGQDWVSREKNPILGRDLKASSNPRILGMTHLRHTCCLSVLSTVSSIVQTWAKVNSVALSYQVTLCEGCFLDQL